MSEVNEVVAPVATEGVVKNDDAVNVAHPVIANAPEVTSPTAGPGVTEAPITDAMVIDYLSAKDPLVIKFKKQVDLMLHNLLFLQDDTWIQHAIDGFEKSDHEERLEKQLIKTVTKFLRNKAFEDAIAAGKTPVDPSKEEIMKEVKLKMAERQKKLQQSKDYKIAKAKAAIIASK